MTDAAKRIVPVVLAGGTGTRLWPLSRTARPKQFLPLTGDKSLFQMTLERLNDPSRYAAPVIVTNAAYRFLVAEQALACGVTPGAILLEPMARNTAPAIAAAVVWAVRNDPDAMIHVLASDHDIAPGAAYFAAIENASAAAGRGALVTFGISPTEPATGFGYIEAGAPVGEGVNSVTRFVEKPDRAHAEEMLAAGGYYWNSGMFMFSGAAFLQECERLAPAVHAAATAAVADAVRDLDFVRLGADGFGGAPDISIDYALFEKTTRAAVAPAAFEWSDLGSWDAVWKSGDRDADDNLTRGPASVLNTSGSLIVSEKLHVAVDGLQDIAVIASEDAIYVGKLSEAQGVGALVRSLRADAATRPLTEVHQTSYRPWGGYSSVLGGERFQVKRLFVNPGKRLSLQKHHHRSEHWVVVRGTAEVTLGEDVRALGENESVYIPRGMVHRLANPGRILLELIEVQTGSYLGEDDIIRIDDEFGRS